MSRRLVSVLLLIGALSVGACGRGAVALGPPPPVPVKAVPDELKIAGGLTVRPNTSAEVRRAFEPKGTKTLATQGRVWEVRMGSQLVGVLQLTSLNDRVNTSKDADRQSIRSQILPGTETEFEVATTPVWTAKDDGRGTYVWFGRQMMGVLQMKSDQFEPDAAATEMVTTLLESKSWPALPPEAFEDD